MLKYTLAIRTSLGCDVVATGPTPPGSALGIVLPVTAVRSTGLAPRPETSMAIAVTPTALGAVTVIAEPAGNVSMICVEHSAARNEVCSEKASTV
jgi:hypothetical protein